MDSEQSGQQQGPRHLSRRGVLKAGLAAGALAGSGAWTFAPGPGLRKPGSLPYPALPAGTDTIPQIEHIVVLMMENHSYDNRLGMLRRPGANGFRLGRDGLPTATNRYANGEIQHAFRMPTTCQINTVTQEWGNSHIQYDNGKMDGFVITSGAESMGYWQEEDQPFYYSMARQFPIADAYHCSVLGQTYPNRRYLLAATSIGQVNDTTPSLTDYPPNGTIYDQLDAHAITWKDYYTDLATTELSLRTTSRPTSRPARAPMTASAATASGSRSRSSLRGRGASTSRTRSMTTPASSSWSRQSGTSPR
jgi:phospholipase C